MFRALLDCHLYDSLGVPWLCLAVQVLAGNGIMVKDATPFLPGDFKGVTLYSTDFATEEGRMMVGEAACTCTRLYYIFFCRMASICSIYLQISST